jgi:hypothetical protein
MKTTRITTEDLEQSFQRMIDNWPSEFIARTQIESFTGGMMSYKSQANLDSLGKGPGRIKRGGKIGYLTRFYVDWLRSQMTIGGI